MSMKTTIPESDACLFALHVIESSKYSAPKFRLLARCLLPSADNSVTDDKQSLTVIAVKRSKKAFQKVCRQHVEGPRDSLKPISMR